MSHDVLILTEAELRQAVSLDMATIDTVERAFAALAGEGVIMPPIMSMELAEAHGEVDAKTAVLPGFESFALKVSTGFFGNTARGLPALNGLMVVFSAVTGLVEAVLLDNGYLTDIRTAAAGAVAARHLAPEGAETLGIMGTGLQARLQAEAVHLVRPAARVKVWGRDGAKAAACARDIVARLGIPAEPEPDPSRLVAASQIVVTTTPARAPILLAEWLHPGLLVIAMGSDADFKNEIDPGALAAADLYIADRVSQCAALGELRSAIAAGLMRAEGVPELGHVVTGAHQGRASPEAVIIADLTGTGAQDTAIATGTLGTARAAGAGSMIST